MRDSKKRSLVVQAQLNPTNHVQNGCVYCGNGSIVLCKARPDHPYAVLMQQRRHPRYTYILYLQTTARSCWCLPRIVVSLRWSPFSDSIRTTLHYLFIPLTSGLGLRSLFCLPSFGGFPASPTCCQASGGLLLIIVREYPGAGGIQ